MKKYFLLLSISILFIACPGTDDNMPTDNFDRQLMLSNWADNIIIPGLQDFAAKTELLFAASELFKANPNSTSLSAVRSAWLEAYKIWQHVSMYEIGKAGELTLQEKLNLYPTDATGIEENIALGGYNLDLPAERTRQGFPALDYLLHGSADDDQGIIDVFENDATYGNYLMALATRIDSMTDEVLADWEGSFRDAFVNNNGNSATAATDMLVNDYLFFYERYLRAGKVGIPAGVFSSTGTLPQNVEAFHNQEVSKILLLEALDAVQNFFNGQHYGSTVNGSGLSTYLDELGATKGGQSLTQVINEQFDAARNQINTLDDNFVNQINTDNTAMLAAYDQLQLNVVNLKVDMLQALNITVDFIDADGD